MTIETLRPEDMDELVYLHGKYLNYGEGVRPHFEEALRSQSTIAVKCVEAGAIAGIAIYTFGITLSGDHPEILKRILDLTRDAPAYTGDAVLVVPEYRKRGVASRLNEVAKRRMLEAHPAAHVLHEMWVYPDGRIPARGVIEATYGIGADLGVYPGYYRDFHHYGYVCPLCGRRCVCSAQIVLSRIAREGGA